jgi:hypothetical protein
MSDAKKAPPRHPSTLIPTATVEAVTIRVYLSRLEPPLTLEQSLGAVYHFVDNHGRNRTDNHASRVKSALQYIGQTRDFLRVAVDAGLIDVSRFEETGA